MRLKLPNPYKKDYPLYLMKVTNSRKLVKVNQIFQIVQEHFGKFLNLCRYRAENFWRHYNPLACKNWPDYRHLSV